MLNTLYSHFSTQILSANKASHLEIYVEKETGTTTLCVDVVSNLMFLGTAVVVKMVTFEFISLISSILTLNLNIELYNYYHLAVEL